MSEDGKGDKGIASESTLVNGDESMGVKEEDKKKSIIIPSVVANGTDTVNMNVDHSKLTPQESVAMENARIQALRDADFIKHHGRLLRPENHAAFDPFRRDVLPPPPKLVGYMHFILAVFLVPLRLMVAFNGCFVSYILVKIFGPKVTQRDLLEYNTSDLSAWRRKICELATRIMARSLLFSLGFWGVNGSHASGYVPVKGATIVTNHVGIGDPVLLAYLYAPSFVAKMAVAKLPLIGRVGSAQHSMYIDRFNGGVRNTTEAMVARQRECFISSSNSNLPPLCIFPEGTTTNGKYLLRFRTGAFVAGTPVAPVLLRYHSDYFPLSFEAIKAHKYILGMLLQPHNHVYYHQLPVYYPTEEEKNNPKLYADNVRQYMYENSTEFFAEHGGLQLRDSNYIDKREYMTVLRGDKLQAGLQLTQDKKDE